ncbi:MAG: hypothetical protein IJX96_01925 [Clostridia bacterium]|nr:hypothetical protein [Clostridia bacterium]
MNENIGVQEEISLSEIFRILLKKVKLLVLVLVLGVIAGGAFGAFRTYNVHYYGTQIEFYVNPSKSEEVTTGTGSQYGVYGAYGKQVMESMIELLESEHFSEVMFLNDEGMPEGFDEEIDALIAAGDKEAAFNAWRASANYKTLIAQVSKAVTFAYTTNSSSTEDNLAKSFIYVKISVLNNKNFAELLRERVLVCVPEFITENMVKPEGYDTTNCQRITRLDEVQLTNPGEMQSTIIKYGVLLGLATFLVTCIVLIVIDYSDKRLRNFEHVMEKFKVPVLGVIPSMSAESLSNANKEAKKQ